MTGRHRILVADDDPSILQWVSQRLVSDGHDVVSVADGYAAIDAARLQTFALALLDVSMPVFSGIEVAQALRATSAHFDIKIVFHTELSEAWVRVEEGECVPIARANLSIAFFRPTESSAKPHGCSLLAVGR